MLKDSQYSSLVFLRCNQGVEMHLGSYIRLWVCLGLEFGVVLEVLQLRFQAASSFFPFSKIFEASSYLNSRLLDYVTIGYIEPRSHYLGNWEP